MKSDIRLLRQEMARNQFIKSYRASRIATIKRTVNGVTKVIRANYRKLAEGNEPDIPLMDGDTIWLKESFL